MPDAFIHISLVYLFTLTCSIAMTVTVAMLSMRQLTRGMRAERITQDGYFEARNLSLFSIFFFARYSILLAASVSTIDLVLFYRMVPEKSPLMLGFIWTFTVCGYLLSAHFIDAFWVDVFGAPKQIPNSDDKAREGEHHD
jgi:hypothetical protein